jgi:predicted component of type VI protein secretion system
MALDDAMFFRLLSLTENADIPLDKPVVLVGRHQECDVQIHSRKISRKHCCIAQVNDYVVVRDLFSTNGVCINGQRVEQGSLKVGDELSIAHFRYEVVLGQKDVQEAATAEHDGPRVAYDDPNNPDLEQSIQSTEKASDDDEDSEVTDE